MVENSIELLKYPIGKFKAPLQYSGVSRSSAIDALKSLPESLEEALKNYQAEEYATPYRPEGWTVNQLIHHIADSHLNSYTRFKLGITEENPTIRPYDQDAWANTVDVQLDPKVSINIISGIHQKLTTLLENFNDSDFQRTIYHPELDKKISLDYLTAMYAWHSNHHLAHITQLNKRKGW